MTLIAGLGNPGPKYENTRHNIGFMLIDLLKDSNFKDVSSAKFQGEVFKFNDIILLKPTTFMNLSGQSVKAVKDFYKPDRIIVIHDDLDLSFGAVKFKKGGRSHKSFKFHQQHRSTWRFYSRRADTLASWLFDGCRANFRSIFWLKLSHQKRGQIY